jgi:formylglycine-generating enzyme required for sulfatase activity
MNTSLPLIAEPERRVFTLPGGATMAFRLIPAGSFRMGSRGESPDEEPIHRVRIKEPFWLAETPVTQAQFAEWTAAEGVEHENGFPGHPDRPAESMDWRQANACCAWLSQVIPAVRGNGLPPGYSLFCLPTEAEWEYVCRAGTETDYHTGDGEAALAEAGWFDKNSGAETHPVGQKRANTFGLHDLHGNVWEWCHGVYDGDAYRRRVDGDADPGAEIRTADWEAGLSVLNDPDDDRLRVFRGGSWVSSAGWCRSAFRLGWRPVVRFGIRGFRVCLVRGPASQPEAPRAPGVGGQGTRQETDGAEGAGADRDANLSHAHISGAAGRNFFAENPLPNPTVSATDPTLPPP